MRGEVHGTVTMLSKGGSNNQEEDLSGPTMLLRRHLWARKPAQNSSDHLGGVLHLSI